MNKSNQTETNNATLAARSPIPAAASPQTKRYDEEFKKQAVENWINAGTS